MQNSSAFQYLAIDTIHESTTNPRRTFDEFKLQELAESIRHHPAHHRSPQLGWLRV
jgi:ParB family chromosome partitioning protein